MSLDPASAGLVGLAGVVITALGVIVGHFVSSRSQNRATAVQAEAAKKTAEELAGRTDNNRVVNFPAPSPHRDRLIGRFVDVRITAALPHSLRGEIITRES